MLINNQTNGVAQSALMPTPQEKELVRVAASRQTDILGCRLSLLAGEQLADQLVNWSAQRTFGYICVSNTHMVVLSRDDRELHNAMQNALAVTTDSQVLANAMNRLDRPYPGPVLYGPDLMKAVIEKADAASLTIALYGSTEQVCEAVRQRVSKDHPGLNIVAIECPPIASLDDLTTDTAIEPLIQAKPDIVLVSLGCPKQERWMHRVANRLPAVMIGLGGAFDFYGGVRQRSPQWVHRYSLEWLYRLINDPRRLLTRYLVNNPRFIWLWIGAKLRNSRS